MQKYIYLSLMVLIVPFCNLCASLQPKTLSFDDPFDRTPIRVTKRVMRANKREMLRELQRQLFEAAAAGDLKKIRKLYAEYGDVDMVSDRPRMLGLTPIYMAVKSGKLETVTYLAQHAFMTRLFPHEACPAQETAEGSQAGKAAQGSDLVAKKPEAATTKTGIAVNTQKSHNAESANGKDNDASLDSDETIIGVESLLDVAIRHGHTDVALFLSDFIPLWLPNGEGTLPVCNALRCGRGELAKALILAHSSNIGHLLRSEATKMGHSPLACARSVNNTEVAALIVDLLAKNKPKELAEKEAEELEVMKRSSQGINLKSPWVVVPGLCLASGLLLYFIKSKSSESYSSEQFSFFNHMSYGKDSLE